MFETIKISFHEYETVHLGSTFVPFHMQPRYDKGRPFFARSIPGRNEGRRTVSADHGAAEA